MTASAPPPHHLAASEALRFLQGWFARCPTGQLLEMRPLHRGGKPLARTWCATVDEAFESAGDYIRHGDDVYVGALPRVRRGGTAEDVGARTWLWGDIDYGTVGHAKPSPYATARRPWRRSTPSGSRPRFSSTPAAGSTPGTR